MTRTDFEWEELFSRASFKEIRKLSPDLRGRRFPSCFSPDGRSYYVSSLDLAIATTDPKELREFLRILGEDFHGLGAEEYQRRYLFYKDFEQICLMLLNLEGEDNDFGLPGKILVERAYDQ